MGSLSKTKLIKKIALLLIVTFLSYSVSAQFERVVPENGYVKFLRTLKGDYAMVYNSEDAAAFDEKAQTIMNIDYDSPVGGYWSAFDLSDTSVVFTGGAFTLDIGGWFGSPFYVKFDKNWEYDWFLNFYDGYPNVEKAIDNGFVSYYEASIYRYNADASKQWDFYEAGLVINDLATNANYQIIAATNQGLLILDSLGQNDTLYANFDFTHLEAISFGNLVGTKADTLYLFNSNFEVINKAPISGQIVKDMKSMEERVAVLTESNHVYIYDQDLMPISDFQLDYAHLTFRNIVPDQDGLVLAGDHHYGVYPSGNAAIFIKKFGVDGFDPFDRRDIGMQFVQPATHTDVWPENGKYKVRFHDVKFQVFNYSDTVLTSFRANVRFPDLPMEWPMVPSPVPQLLYEQFNNLNLAPGQSTTLIWDEFTATLVEYPSGSNLELCFWSSMPDGKSDINPNNDVACADFFVNDEEVISEQTAMEVYPNPTDAGCTIYYQLGQALQSEIRLYDALGRILKIYPIDSAKHTLNIDALVPGLNVVVWTAGGVVLQTEKIIRK